MDLLLYFEFYLGFVCSNFYCTFDYRERERDDVALFIYKNNENNLIT